VTAASGVDAAEVRAFSESIPILHENGLSGANGRFGAREAPAPYGISLRPVGASCFLPLRRRALITRTPPGVLIRLRKPCTRRR
jgi:hypothetical protein